MTTIDTIVPSTRSLLPPQVVFSHAPRFWAYRHLIWELAVRDIRARYQQSVLGLYWAFIHPLTIAAIMGFVFAHMLRVQIPNMPFIIYHLSGVIVWSLFSNSVTSSVESVSGFASLVGKVNFPRMILPVATVLSHGIDFLFSLAVLGVFMTFYGIWPSIAALWAIPVIALVMVLAVALALAVSALSAVFRDVGQIVQLGLSLWFFLCPIFYSVEAVTERYRPWLVLNPMGVFIEAFRAGILYGRAPTLEILLLAATMSSGLLLLGALIFRRYEAVFAEVM